MPQAARGPHNRELYSVRDRSVRSPSPNEDLTPLNGGIRLMARRLLVTTATFLIGSVSPWLLFQEEVWRLNRRAGQRNRGDCFASAESTDESSGEFQQEGLEDCRRILCQRCPLFSIVKILVNEGGPRRLSQPLMSDFEFLAVGGTHGDCHRETVGRRTSKQ